ncbi:MAG: hypothetical protein ACRD3N_14575, partial [Terracidiphilus sp.]
MTPVAIANRPGLPAIDYRVGVYATFLATMEAALSGSNVPALAGLRTRSSGDFSIALVDAWSEVLDILTFYTERLANEAYLGTAIEGRSVFELARLVGYKPSPGVSASTVLAFTLATAASSPAIVPIAAGTRVQSVPGPGQSPQIFETSSALTATIANNAIPAATSQPWQLNGGDTSTWIAGTSNNIQVGNVLLFLSTSNGVPSANSQAAVCFVTSVSIDSVGGNTFITWDQPLPSGFAKGESAVCLYVFRTKAALYGANAPPPGLFTSTTLQHIPPYPKVAYPGTPPLDWPWVYAGNSTINLDNSYSGLNPTASSANSTPAMLEWAVMIDGGTVAVFQIASATESNPAFYALTAKTTQLTMAASAIQPSTTASAKTSADSLLKSFVNDTRKTTVYVQSQLLPLANLPLTAWTPQSNTYPLTAGMLAPTTGESILLAGLQPIADNAPIGVNGKRVRIAPQIALTGSGAAGVN